MAKSQMTKNTQQQYIFSGARSIDTSEETTHKREDGGGTNHSESWATYLPSEFNLQEQNIFPMTEEMSRYYHVLSTYRHTQNVNLLSDYYV